jgi:serine/threonine protein kinase/predicted ATPase/Tfp pilus assembly protein PilF
MTSLIANRYLLQEEVGRGGIGLVYKALDKRTGQTVAVKLLRPEQLDATPNLFERFRREGEALRELDHPNIVKVLDVLDDEDNHYIVEEYFAGGDLAQAIHDGSLSIEKVLNIALELADALTRAHHLNIIHRDLKPANVLLAEDGTPRLTDFGVALIGGKKRMTEQGTPVGTIEYLSPEALTADVDNRADIWAFGVMLFEMLAGFRPFRGTSLAELVSAILNHPVPDLEILRPDVPSALVDLIYRMLEKERSARISSARLVGAELEAIMQGQTVDNRAIPAASGIFIASRFIGEVMTATSGTRHNLPSRSTSFIGREAEIEKLMGLINDGQTRLITIQGTGGIGKTRLAIELGDRSLAAYQNRVFFVDLAPLREGQFIVPTIAEALRYKFQQDGRSQSQQIKDYLHSKKTLLLFDNFEHLQDNAGIVAELIAAAPMLKVLVTSRQRLNLSGEAVVMLEGMDFPKELEHEEVLNTSPVKLFLQSARRVTPDYELHENDVPELARICKLVQGLPLGILLAASWVGMLSLKEIADEIAEDADFLSTDMGDVVERHRSMRAVFDYSWWLLEPEEQNTFMKLAVFRAGFTREAATEVVGANLRMMMALMNKSLLRRNPDDGRYSIHDLLRQYAKEKLEESQHKEEIRHAHMRYYAQLGFEQGQEFYGGAQLRALELLDAELPNLRAAWMYAVNVQDHESLGKYTIMWPYFDVHGLWEDVINACELTLRSLPNRKIELAGDIATMAGISSYRMGSIALATDYTNEALRIYNELDVAHKLLQPRMNQALIWCNTGEVERGLSQLRDIVEQAQRYGHHWQEAMAYLNLGYYTMVINRLDEAESYLRQSLEISRRLSDLLSSGVTLHNLGDIAYRRGDIAQAKDLLNESLSIGMMFDSVVVIYANLIYLAKAMIEAGDYNAANDYLHRAAGLAEETSYRRIDHLGLTALLALRQGRLVDAKTTLRDLLRDSQAAGFVETFPEAFEALPFVMQRLGRDDEAAYWAGRLLSATISEAPVIERLQALQEEVGTVNALGDTLSKIDIAFGILGLG